jgi:DNA-binding transcriptional MerR regulator
VSNSDRYSLTELADLAGVTPRTVRYYVGQGLLPGAGQSGPGSKYDDGHRARLRLIRRLQAEHLPLAEIRRRLDDLGDDEIRELAGTGEPEPPADSALDYLRTVLGGPAARPALARPRANVTVPPPLRRSMSMGLAEAAAPAPAAAPSVPPAVTGQAVPVPPAPPATPAAPAIERSQWDRIALAPDVELHIRRPLVRAQQKQVDRLVTIARELLEEDRS